MQGQNHFRTLFKQLPKQVSKLVILFFLCFFLLFSSGRLASLDAGLQLQATMLLVTTGSLGTKIPPGGLYKEWVLSPNGNYYQPHDIGNILLMLPTALISSIRSQASAINLVETPPIIAKVGVSLTYTCISAIGCFFLFKLFRLYYKTKTAFLLSLAFPTTTIFWAYAKTAWDVVAACCFVSALLYYSARIVNSDRRIGRNVILATAMFALACSFRFSLIPFFGIGLAIILYFSRHKLQWNHYIACVTTFAVVMIPSLIYNYVRMGSPLRPATTAPQYLDGNNALTGNILEGFFGLLFAPNRGLFVYSPILLLLFILPFIWHKIPLNQRYVLMSFNISAFFYLLLISKFKGWGAFGWGPRYLLPILPVLFFGASTVAIILWRNYRNYLVGLIFVSVLLSIPPVLVNWNMATTEFPKSMDSYALLPYQQIAVWNGMFLGFQGKPLSLSLETSDPLISLAAKFPDFLIVRLMEKSYLGLFAGIIIMLLLVIPLVFSLVCLLKTKRSFIG